MAEEKIFNLQLTISKLEEELQLYRNGTSAGELLDLIHEKDIEIESFRLKLEEKDDKLKKLAKTSGDVLYKFEHLQQELVSKSDENTSLEMKCNDLFKEILSRDSIIETMKKEKKQFEDELRERADQIGQLRLQIWEMENKNTEDIDILKRSNHELSVKNTELSQTIHGLEDKLKSQNNDLVLSGKRVEELTYEINNKWKKYLEEQDQSIEKLQKRCASLVAEKNDKLKEINDERQIMITKVQEFRDAMNNNLAQRDEILKKKDDKIREVRFSPNFIFIYLFILYFFLN